MPLFADGVLCLPCRRDAGSVRGGLVAALSFRVGFRRLLI